MQAALDDAAGGVLVALQHAPAGVLVPGDAEYAEGRGDHKGVSDFPWGAARPCADKQFTSAEITDQTHVNKLGKLTKGLCHPSSQWNNANVAPQMGRHV